MVFGLPLHPLVVHFAVVLIPLGAMALLVVYFVPRWRTRYLPLATVLTVAGALAAVAAKFTGEAFAGQVGLPAAHQRWGNLVTITSLLLGAAATVWTLQSRRAAAGEQASGSSRPAGKVAGLATVLLAVAATLLAILTGHSGAQSVWGETAGAATPSASNPPSTQTPSPSPTSALAPSTSAPEPSDSPSQSEPATYTLAEIAEHSDASSCWTAVDGNVYDVTEWIERHPGGPERIMALCGTDATSAFRNQHGSQSEPNAELASFQIGTLG